MKVKDILEVGITSYAFEGKGIARVNLDDPEQDLQNFVIFVEKGYPGDLARIQITKKKKNYANAQILEILTPSSERITPKCKFFGTCGGCKQQDMDYSAQLKYKQLQVTETFTQLGGFENFRIEEIVPSKETFFYRNKMEFSFGDRRWLLKEEIDIPALIRTDYALGLHVPGRFDRVLNIDECFLQSHESNGILNFTYKFFLDKQTTVYSTKTHTGFLRNLAIRHSYNTKDLMVNLVTSEENSSLLEEYTDKLIKLFPSITTVVNNITASKSGVAVGEREVVLYGEGFIYDTIGSYKFRISANSFFQTNTSQALKLYDTALNFADLSGNEILYDLYSGAGTIAVYMSSFTKEIHGFESVLESVKNAEQNVIINSVNNVTSHNVDLYKSFLPYITQNNLPKPDVIVVDPPRNGMHTNTIDDILQLAPSKIVYISCNPATQVRDIKLMTPKYKLVKIKPVDMFPHTYHIENVALLIKT